ncbi:lactonase family protein [Stigmatella sp. ncwal1]|uniref:Lactonase family protein n=1 Tax=Stigmatella ashevillensis TaxID=2995309 RepID=A0ABT5D675_9BACT|nr:lactonase family protein [Stigmatella ashevillena]MDC0708605.1 lactonase family protein [Stigmatella ashevillena]
MTQLKLTRRHFLYLAGLGTAGTLLACGDEESPDPENPDPPKELWVYVGTYTTGQESQGIYLCRLDLETGVLQQVGVTPGVADPSFLAVDGKRRYLYAVNELTSFEGKPSGAVSAFTIHPETHALTFINQQATQGGAPCHLEVDAKDGFVLVANYVGGNVAVLPIQEGGGLGPTVEVKQHEGSGPNTDRQEGPHAHQVRLDATQKYAFVSDLGTDKIMVYQFDAGRGKLTPHQPASVATQPGAGPRHLTFHPNGRFAFNINELNSTLTAFAYDSAQGTLTPLQTVPALPEGFTGASYCADIHVSPDGRFLYGSNRGHDSIVVYAIGPSGQLTYVEHVSTLGRWPRNFTIDSTGTYLLVANQHTHSIVTFRRDAETGKLTPVGQPLEIPAPVCLLLVPA